MRYAMPVRILWERLDRQHFDPKALAAVRQAAKEGTLIDAATQPAFISHLLADLRRATTLQEGDYRIEFKPTEQLRAVDDAPIANVRAVETEQSNSTALVDDRYVVKIYRKLENGINPEIEVGRFLTDVAGFHNTPALLGSIELTGPDAKSAVGIVHAFVENQGDAWTLTSAALDRFVEDRNLVGTSDTNPADDEQSAYQRYMIHTGKRVAEMQIALASRDDFEDFRPEAATREDTERWIDGVLTRAERTFARIKDSRINPVDAPLVEQLLAERGHAAGSPHRPAPAARAHSQHPPPRGFSSGADADRQGRHLHHRLRRRAPAYARGTEKESAGSAGRRRPDPLDRLLGWRGAGTIVEGEARRSRTAGDRTRPMARRKRRDIPRAPIALR